MCGRYSLTREITRFRNRFGYNEQLAFTPRYNIAPGQTATVIISQDQPHLLPMR